MPSQKLAFERKHCRTASYLRSNKDTYKREQSKTKLALILFSRAKVSSSFNSNIVKGECNRAGLHAKIAEPPPIFCKDTIKPRAKTNLFVLCRGGVSKTKSKIGIKPRFYLHFAEAGWSQRYGKPRENGNLFTGFRGAFYLLQR